MRYTKQMTDAYKNRILINADAHPNDLVQYCMKNLSLSKNTVIKYIDGLIKDGRLLRTSVGRFPSYSLPVDEKIFSFLRRETQSEEAVWQAIVSFVGEQPHEVAQILDYSFLEMCNNVLEHSEAESFTIKIEKTLTKICIVIDDDGVGIFAKIKNELHLASERQAIIELSKGKFTSSPQNHSGEGIFFSSKLCDEFYVFSDGLSYSPQEEIPPEFIPDDNARGTRVVFVVHFDTKKTAQKIFAEYAGANVDEPQFKTVIQMRFMAQEGMALTSRSQARRLLNRLEKFTCAVFDFKDVDFIGQAFADEIFRVYPTKNTRTELQYINAVTQIEKMIAHVRLQA